MTDQDQNALEALILGGAGQVSQDELHVAVLGATLFVPSATEVGAEGQYTPLRLPMPDSPWWMTVAFTGPERITTDARTRAPYVFEVEGLRLVRNLLPDTGLVIFAGPDKAVMFDPPMLIEIRRRIYR